jgi:hypothetical protein
VFWSGTVTSQYALIKQGAHYIDIREGSYQFAGGTRIEEGGIVIGENITFQSDIDIRRGAWLSVLGTVVGNVKTDAGGLLQVFGTLHGNVVNEGITGVAMRNPQLTAASPPNRIDGDFRQSDSGTLGFSLPYLDYFMPLAITGRADLDGTLSLTQYVDWDLGPYPLPTSAMTLHLIRANGGVFGSFDRWTSPGLFIEGSLRYGSNDVWFDLTRISVQTAMASQGFEGMTLASAGNLDQALSFADGFAAAPDAMQSRFLQSAGRLLWLADAEQAARSLDSLAGSLHVDAMRALTHDDALARGIGTRTLMLQPGTGAGAWSQVHGGNTLAGFDQWVSPRLLAGATAAQVRDARSDGVGGHAQHDAPQAAAYLRWFGNHGWYAGGSAGYARHALALDRHIDLADGGHWTARAQRRLGIASFDAEAGRRLSLGGMTVAPYLWLGADAVRSERALEQGQTGFELALQANTQTSLDAGLGLCVGRQWRFGERGWLALDADARYRHGLMQSADPLRAAFIGVPDAWFDVPASEARSGTWLDLGLRGGFGRGWAWSLGHAGSLAGQADGHHWQVGLTRRF